VVLYETALKPFTERIEAEEVRGRQRILYIIRNSQVKAEWENVKPRVGPIAGRAIGTLIKTQGVGDLYRLYAFAKRDKIDYNLAASPTDQAPTRPKEPFDRIYMNQLFDLGYEMAAKGYPWLKHPPGFDPEPILKKSPQTAQSIDKTGLTLQ
jgi:hypothetical protein